MSSPLTCEDLKEEFQRLALEIRQFSTSVREDVRSELRSFLHDCSSSLRPQELATEKRSAQKSISLPAASLDSLKQPAATGTLVHEAREASESAGRVHEQQPFLRSAKRDRRSTAPPAPSTSFASDSESHSKVRPAPPGMVEEQLRLKSPEAVQLPLDLDGTEPSSLDLPFAGSGQPFPASVYEARKVPTTAGRPRSTRNLPTLLSIGSARSASLENLTAEEEMNRHASAKSKNSWLPGYREYSDDKLLGKREGTASSSTYDSLSRPTSIALLVWRGEVSKAAAIGMFFKGQYFDYVMGIFLILNGVSIGVQVDIMAKRKDDTVPLGLRINDGAFCIIFIIELLIRLYVWRGQFLRMKGWQWNGFDICVVLLTMIDELTKLALAGTKVSDAIKSLFVLKMLRLARVARLIRMVRLIPELKSMVYLISASMWSFFWSLVLLLILIYCVAVYFTELGTDLRVNEGQSLQPAVVEGLLTYYGSLGTAMFTLFQAITGGDDWVNFVNMFEGQSYFINSFLFSVYIAFGTLVMLNLVTGVFVEGAHRIIREDKEAEFIRQVHKLFHVGDKDQSGEITLEEFAAQLDRRAMRESLAAVDMSPDQALSIFLLLDLDKSGGLSVDEFVQGCLRLRVPARSVDLSKLKYDFDEITSLWAAQFASMDANIRQVMETQMQLAHAVICNMPAEGYEV